MIRDGSYKQHTKNTAETKQKPTFFLNYAALVNTTVAVMKLC